MHMKDTHNRIVLRNDNQIDMQQQSSSRMEEEPTAAVFQCNQGYCHIQPSCQLSSLSQYIAMPGQQPQPQHLVSLQNQQSQKMLETNACKLHSSMLTNSQKAAFKSAITKLQLRVQRNSLHPSCEESIRLLNKLALIIRSRSDWVNMEQFTQSIDDCLDVFVLDCGLMQSYELYLQQKVIRQQQQRQRARKQECQEITSSASRTMQKQNQFSTTNNTSTVLMCDHNNVYSNRTSCNLKNSWNQTTCCEEGEDSWKQDEYHHTQYSDNMQLEAHRREQQFKKDPREYQRVQSASSFYPSREAFQQIHNSQSSCIENINPLILPPPPYQCSQPSFIEQPSHIPKRIAHHPLNQSISSQIESDNFHSNKIIPSLPASTAAMKSIHLENPHNSSSFIGQSQKSYIEYSVHCDILSAVSSIPSSQFKTPENSQTHGLSQPSLERNEQLSSFLRQLETINQEINNAMYYATQQEQQQRPEPLMPTSISSRYRYVCNLGSGGYSQVYQYSDMNNAGRFVAVKEISVLQDEVDSKRVLREIYIQKQLEHANVMQILEVHHNKTISNFNVLYLVLDYYPFTLADLIYKYSPLLVWNHDVVHAILKQLLNGLAYIHSRNVIHRDIKPNNILVDQHLNVKIADFTLATTYISSPQAQAHSQSKTSSKHSRQSSSFMEYKSLNTGSRYYRAPEIILLNPSYDFKVDIWSLGCVLAEVLQTLNLNTPHRGPLFPGKSCYPMSKPDQDPPPARGDKGNSKEPHVLPAFGSHDQLYLIIKLLGTPEPSECKFIVKESALKFLQALQFTPYFHYSQLFPSANVSELFLLEKMLQFSPELRVSSEVLLTTQFGMKNNTKNHQDSFLDEYDHRFNPIFVDFEIQFHQEGNGLFLNFHHLRRLFIREIHYFSPLEIYPGKIEAYIHDLLQEIQRKRLLQSGEYNKKR